MKIIENKSFDAERALYGSDGIELKNCAFAGEADGESAIKESKNIFVDSCRFELRYPLWHCKNVQMTQSELTDACRAALWYSEGIKINNSKLHGIKALRECINVDIRRCDVNSSEFGWFVKAIDMLYTHAEGEYFMFGSSHLNFKDVDFKGKYSFQYISNASFDNCVFDTKDAFWHAKNVTVKNSTVKGEYLAWYAEDITFEKCKIIGTQPLCYCKNLKLVDCEMIDTDLCFELSEVEADIKTSIDSVKNPISGYINALSVGELIIDIPDSKCVVKTKK